MMSTPILFSFRRCPYAMRARMAIAYSKVSVELREVVLKDKPPEMLAVSPKGTVPVLTIGNKVLEESLDIMFWALKQNDPDGINLSSITHYLDNALINENDNAFKTHLDHYKYADRFPAHDQLYYREQGEVFLATLEARLNKNTYLTGDNLSIVDIAIFPFIRQFVFVNKAWFEQSDYKKLQQWLNAFLSSDLFASVMLKYPQWQPGDNTTFFPG